MARTDWTALQTAPAAEYLVVSELERFGLDPYLPQFCRRHRPSHSHPFVSRRYPLFPRYLFIPLNQASTAQIANRMVRGLDRLRPVLAHPDGRPWRAPSQVIDVLRQAETAGQFDENLRSGDSVIVTTGPCAGIRAVLASTLIATVGADTVELFTPLFGGTRATVSAKRVVSSSASDRS